MQKSPYPPKCLNGHKLNKETVYVMPQGGKWRCRVCLRACSLRYRANRRAALEKSGYTPYDRSNRIPDTHCRKGHLWTPQNTYTTPSNPEKRQCKTCRNDRHKARRLAGSLQILHQTFPEDGFIF